MVAQHRAQRQLLGQGLARCISANTGVSCSQRRRYTENRPNTPPSRNGIRQA
jgi:hypothetical protein